jgi:hypothetical protein
LNPAYELEPAGAASAFERIGVSARYPTVQMFNPVASR